MKWYTISKDKEGKISLHAESQTQKGIVEHDYVGGFDIGNVRQGSYDLAKAIMEHFYDASPQDPNATAEAHRKVEPFLNAFLLHMNMKAPSKYQINSDVIENWIGKL